MKKEEHPTELDFIASIGFAAYDANDAGLQSARRKWYKRHNGARWYLYLTLFAVVVSVVVWQVNIKKARPEFHKQLVDNKPAKPEILETPIVGHDSVHQQELFVRASGEGATVKDLAAAEPVSPDNLAARQLVQLPDLMVEEKKLQYMINTPLFYIHDLKVSNYQLLYFRKNKFVPSGGVPASESDEFSPNLPDQPERWLHSTLADALLLYQKAEYFQCVGLLDEISKFNTDDINCDFYRGMCWFQMKHYDKALVFLTRCIESSNNAFLQESQYYAAMALKQSGQSEKARDLFLKIVHEEGFYATKAKQQL